MMTETIEKPVAARAPNNTRSITFPSGVVSIADNRHVVCFLTADANEEYPGLKEAIEDFISEHGVKKS